MNNTVRAKKQLGQHFLTDESIAEKIVQSLTGFGEYKNVLEIGPGMGVLTKCLLKSSYDLKAIDVDGESIEYLKKNYPNLEGKIIHADFLRMDMGEIFENKFAIIGNFPYNISTQILFKVLEYKDQIPEVVGMFQKEVAERIAEPPGSKAYGILSVFLQAFYKIDYLFTVHEHVFSPPPKVKSAVIRLQRNEVKELPCDEKLFWTVVKTAFNQRRKTLWNSLKPLLLTEEHRSHRFMSLRAERLSVNDFIELTLLVQKNREKIINGQ